LSNGNCGNDSGDKSSSNSVSAALALPDRKISVGAAEWCQMSEYRGADASTTTLV
jgi:hypothetical protein